MFFIAGVSSKQKLLDFHQTIICPHCGSYGRYEVLMEYMYLSLFFIPLFKWNKRYYVKSTCCNTIYNISNELGERIARGESVTIKDEDLQLLHQGVYIHRCNNCGYELIENYKFCPNCGTQL